MPSGSGWYITLWQNSLVVAGAKLLVAQAVFPKATAMLARIKHGVRGSVGLTSELATRVHKTQVARHASSSSGTDGAICIGRQTRYFG